MSENNKNLHNKTDLATRRAQVVESTLTLAVDQGWEFLTLRDIAAHAKMSVADLYNTIEDKAEILVLIGRHIDRAVAESQPRDIDHDSTPRERLFDILMDRYDALNDHRDGIIAMIESLKYDPKNIVMSLPHLCRSMGWMLELSGIETSGLKGALKIAGLSALYLKVLRVWMEDDTADMAKTMAALDKALNHVEKGASTLGL